MKERPIDLKPHEVRGIQAGRQTQIRRIAKLDVGGCIKEPGGHRRWHPADPNASHACQYGQPGDRLWGRETFAESDMFDGTPVVAYRAGGCVAVGRKYCDGADYLIHSITFADEAHVEVWRSPILMPRWASRITLDVVAVRVERLQDISEADAKAEGAPFELGMLEGTIFGAKAKYRSGYCRIWESIHGPGSWDANPWVEVGTVRRVEGGAV